ncbi:MAG: hypothetical protein QMB94_03030, partial [Phycisphaerales bacterium]
LARLKHVCPPDLGSNVEGDRERDHLLQGGLHGGGPTSRRAVTRHVAGGAASSVRAFDLPNENWSPVRRPIGYGESR